MTQTQKQWWEQVRAKGEMRFVLCEGLLRRGLPFATFMTVAPLLYDVCTHHPIELTSKMVIAFAFYAVAFGGCMGTMFWRDNEKDYAKPTEDEDVA